MCYLGALAYVGLCARLSDAVPSLWKLDIDSAFRRIPLAVEQRWAAAVAFKSEQKASIVHVHA